MSIRVMTWVWSTPRSRARICCCCWRSPTPPTIRAATPGRRWRTCPARPGWTNARSSAASSGCTAKATSPSSPAADGAETGTPSPWPSRPHHRRRHLDRITPMRRPAAEQHFLPLVEVRRRDRVAVPTLSTGRRGAGAATAPRHRNAMSTTAPARSCRAPVAISRAATGTPGSSGLRRPCPNCRTDRRRTEEAHPGRGRGTDHRRHVARVPCMRRISIASPGRRPHPGPARVETRRSRSRRRVAGARRRADTVVEPSG